MTFPSFEMQVVVILCERSVEIPSLSQDMPTMWSTLHFIASSDPGLRKNLWIMALSHGLSGLLSYA